MGYKITKIRTAIFRTSRKIGDAGEKIVYSIKKIFRKPSVSEKTKIALKKISKTGDKLVKNLKENTQNWRDRMDMGENFKIDKEDA